MNWKRIRIFCWLKVKEIGDLLIHLSICAALGCCAVFWMVWITPSPHGIGYELTTLLWVLWWIGYIVVGFVSILFPLLLCFSMIEWLRDNWRKAGELAKESE